MRQKDGRKGWEDLSCLNISVYWVVKMLHVNLLHVFFFLKTASKTKWETYFNPFILSRWSHLPDSLFWLFSNTRGKQKFSESYVCIKGPINSSTLADYSILIGERWNLAGQESSYLESSQAEYSHFQPVSYLTSPWRWSHAVTMRCKVYIVGLDGLSSRIAVR